MRILMLHNFYQQPGGEDGCFAAEASLLERHGHEVERYVVHNDSVAELGMASVAVRTIWSRDTYRTLRQLMRRFRPQVMHAHNTFPLISPSAFYAAAAESVPVVQTIHNYRLSCVNGFFFRDGRACEDCMGHLVPWPGIMHRCYRGSALLSSGVASTIAVHRLLRTWARRVDIIIALSHFAKEKLVAGGIPASRIEVKPNFLLEDPGPGPVARGGFVLFAGRLSPEKGIATLIRAWAQVPAPLRLKIVGDGPLATQARALAAGSPRVEMSGPLRPSDVLAQMRDAMAVVVPSEWYENCPRVVIEAFAAGTPVVAARTGALAEMVDDGRTGRLFKSGDAAALAATVADLAADRVTQTRMQLAARAEFDARYTVAPNYAALMRIYSAAGAASSPARAA